MQKPKTIVTPVRHFNIVSPYACELPTQPLMAAPRPFTTLLHAFFKRMAMFFAVVWAFCVFKTRRTRWALGH
jgi:hypothetical protein